MNRERASCNHFAVTAGDSEIPIACRTTAQIWAEQAATARYGPPPTPPPLPPSPTPSAGHDDVAHLGLSVEVGDPGRVWALLGPGDPVAIYSTTKTGRVTQVIDRIRVIAVGGRRAVRSTVDDRGIPGTILTVDADDTQARRILQAQQRGELTFAVLGKDPVGVG